MHKLCLIAIALAAPLGAQVNFVDITQFAGVDYQHGGSIPALTEMIPVMCGGAAAADADGDGWVDLFVTRFDRPDILFRNRGLDALGNHRGFEDFTSQAFGNAAPGPRSNAPLFGDVDNDGDQDLFLTSLFTGRYHLFINDGAGHFQEQGEARGVALPTGLRHLGTGAVFGDYDRDGWLDLYVAEWGPNYRLIGNRSHARLLRGRGASAPGEFVDVTIAAGVAQDFVIGKGPALDPEGIWQFTPRFSDLDGDGWPDLAIAGDFGTSKLFWNNSDGTFLDGGLAAKVGGEENGMGAAIADFDGDGRLDWFVTSIFDPAQPCNGTVGCNWGASGNRLYLGRDGRVFKDATDSMAVRDGGWGWGAVAFDYDNDGDVDLGMTNGIVFPGMVFDDAFNDDAMKLWRNDGARFTEVARLEGLRDTGSGKGLLSLDFDRDGDLDLFVVNNAGHPVLYENLCDSSNAWLQLVLRGSQSNRDAVGAKVTLTARQDGAIQFRETSGGGGYLSQDEALVHFGLGPGFSNRSVHEIRIDWPSGQVSTLRHVKPNRRIEVLEP